MTAEEERANELLAEAGIEPRHLSRLALYVRLVLETNQRFNLTGARSVKEFIPQVLDSLTVAPYIRVPYIDVGSGAGLPGIPAAIVAGVEATLLEATAKKAAFLRQAVESLELRARVVKMRAEEAGRDPEYREKFASATARAVASGPAVLELTVPLLAVDGLAILQRGATSMEARNALEDTALILGCRIGAEIPLEGERRLILVRKISATPPRFPRRAGIPEKRPLCG